MQGGRGGGGEGVLTLEIETEQWSPRWLKCSYGSVGSQPHVGKRGREERREGVGEEKVVLILEIEHTSVWIGGSKVRLRSMKQVRWL